MLGASSVCRFGVFEVDLRTEELRKQGMKLRLPRQSFAVLAMLLERPGELVSRDELREKLWPADTFVDFDHGLNAAVNRLREALGDSADLPRFIETLPRRGYRFIASVEAPSAQPDASTSGDGPGAPAQPATQESRAYSAGLNKVSDRRRGPATKWTLVAAMILLAVGIVYWGWLRRTAASNEPLAHADVTVVPFTSFKGQEVSPAFSPDGNQIVFAWDGGNSDSAERFDLYVKVVGSESLLRLTSKPSVWLVPAWSPDGRTIAFLRLSSNGSGIFSVPAIGGPERKLASTAVLQYAPAVTLSWSPDGTELAFAASDPSALWTFSILSVDTGVVRQIPTPQCEESFSPVFSPDGTRLAFNCSSVVAMSRVFVMPRGGGTARQVITVPGIPLPLAWSHDGKRIIFSKEYSADLWEVSSEGGKANALLFARDAVQPAVARQGNRLAYASGHDNMNVWGVDLHGKGKLTPKLLISSTRAQSGPDISPDGKKIAFESDRSGWREVWVSDFDGSNPVQLSDFHSLTGTARWSPDGGRIVFDSKESGISGLYLIDPHGGPSHKISAIPQDASVPSWSRDGRWIYFTSDAPPDSGLYKAAPEGGNAVLLSRTLGYNVQEANDGSLYFAGADFNAEIHVLPKVGGKEKALANMPRVLYPTDWALAANGIYFIDRKGARATLSFFGFENARVRVLTELQKQPGVWCGIALSPDQRWLVYSQIDEKVSDIMLAEHYR
jgi:Tol biopolymer transport system component/DNA-binding winged helix-turn-helix (wHTH) protein